MLKTTKLHKIPKNSILEISLGDGSKYVRFDHVDGLYSYCVSEMGNVIHLYAGTTLEKVSDGKYRIVDCRLTPDK